MLCWSQRRVMCILRKILWNSATLLRLQSTCLQTTLWNPYNTPWSGHDCAYATDAGTDSEVHWISPRHTASKKHGQSVFPVLGDPILIKFFDNTIALLYNSVLGVGGKGGCMCFELCSYGQDRYSGVDVWPMAMCMQVVPNSTGK